MKQCNICKETKELTEFNKASTYKDKVYYRGECRVCNLKMQSSNQASQIKYRNSEKGKTKKKAFKQTLEYKESQRIYEAKRCKEDKMFRLRKRIRDRVGKALKSKKWNKRSHYAEYIGCGLEELREHFEKQFQSGMTWENYGEWEIDHIQALGNAIDEADMIKRCHYTNLQPLWRIDNIKKSNKV